MKIKNLAHMKRMLQVGTIIRTIKHQHEELVGLKRQVRQKQTNGVYTVVLGQPNHKYSKCNDGRGAVMYFDKAGYYEFGDTIKWYNLPVGSPGNKLIMEFEVLDNDNC